MSHIRIKSEPLTKEPRYKDSNVIELVMLSLKIIIYVGLCLLRRETHLFLFFSAPKLNKLGIVVGLADSFILK